jgi:hypothetical protein
LKTASPATEAAPPVGNTKYESFCDIFLYIR